MREWGIASRIMGRFHEKYDLYLTPTMSYPPVRIGELQPKPAERALLTLVNSMGLGKLLKILRHNRQTCGRESLKKPPSHNWPTSQVNPQCPFLFTGRKKVCPVGSTLWGDSETKRHCSGWQLNWNRQGPGSTRGHPWLNSCYFIHRVFSFY